MNDAKPIVLIGIGALIIGAVFASVPHEDRAVQWPVIGTVISGGALVAAMVMRKNFLQGPKGGAMITPSNGVVIPFPRAA